MCYALDFLFKLLDYSSASDIYWLESDLHDLFNQLFLRQVTFVAIPIPLVDLALWETNALCEGFSAFLLELGVKVSLTQQTSFLLDGFRLVITFMLFESHLCHSAGFFFREFATHLLINKKGLRLILLAKCCNLIELICLSNILAKRLWENDF